jgi:tripartite-type tricarboxylate transporter receptor subunit TctC
MHAIWRPLFAVLLALCCASAAAQTYPSKAVRIVVPYPPGGGTDVLARLVGRHLADSFAQPVVIENRAGANAQIGMDLVAKSPADGYTLLAIAAGPLNEDNLRLFAPVSLFAAPSYILVVHPSVQAGSVQELVALAKGAPGRLAYGSTGGGAASHLSMELFKALTGTDILHVPYKGIGSAVNDLLGGQVQLMIAPSQAVIQHVRSGRLRALAVTGGRRSPAVAELPTIAEAGVEGYESTGWFGLVAPAGTAREVVDRLNREVNRVLVLPEVKERLLDLGAEPAQTTPEQFLEFIRTDSAKWTRLIKERGIVIERGS